MAGGERHRRARRSSSSSSSDSGDETRRQQVSVVSSIHSRRHLRGAGRWTAVEKKHHHEEHVSSAWWMALATVIILSPLPFSTNKQSFPSSPTSDRHYSSDHYELTDPLLQMYAEGRQPQYDINMDAFKPRPQGIRWRDEIGLARHSLNNYTAALQHEQLQQQPMMVMPLVTERPRGHVGRQMVATTSTDQQQQAHSSRQDPSIEDIELIDVLWRSDIDAEKGVLQLAPSDQYERDLQLLTEKSIRAPLTDEESSRYEYLAKGYFEDFYPVAVTSSPSLQKATVTALDYPFGSTGSSTVFDAKRDVATPTDDDLDALFDDMSKEGGQLDQLSSRGGSVTRGVSQPLDEDELAILDALLASPTPDNITTTSTPLLNNVSLSQGIVYDQNNVTELTYLREELSASSSSSSSSSNLISPSSLTAGGLYNNSNIEMHPWLQQADVSPNDLYPTHQHNQSSFGYSLNDSVVPVVSTGIHYDHAYQAPAETTANPPASAASSSLHSNSASAHVYDPYYASNGAFTNESMSSSSSSSATSPHYMSESDSLPCSTSTSRYFGKVAPHQRAQFRSADYRDSQSQTSLGSSSSSLPYQTAGHTRRRGRQSKDEELAAMNNLPVSARDIAEMSLTELQRMLKTERLSEYQKNLIKKIRRRGKNKVAARTCRQRRGDRGMPTGAEWEKMRSNPSQQNQYEEDDE